MVDQCQCPDCGEQTDAAGDYCSHCGGSIEMVTADDDQTLSPRSFDASFDIEVAQRDDDGDGRWLDPDGLLDGSLTIVVGAGFGVVSGVLAVLLGIGLIGSIWGSLAGIVVLLGATGLLLSRDSVYHTTRLGCYTTALLLVCLPLLAVTDVVQNGDFVGRITLFGIGELFAGTGAALIAGAGYLAGKRAPPVGQPTDGPAATGSSDEAGD